MGNDFIIICFLGMVAAPQYLAYRKSLAMRDQAISNFNEALEINPRDAEAFFNRANTYLEKGHYEQAISDYTKALEIDPRDAKGYIFRGRTYYFQREYEKSWKDVEKAQYLGSPIDPKFLDDLRKASGRKN